MKRARTLGLAAASTLVLAACGAPTQNGFETDPDYSYAETTALARSTLQSLQAISFRENREYCGYLALSPAGKLSATKAARGSSTSCLPSTPPAGYVLVASYHTHGAYLQGAFSEVPSSTDIQGDAYEGVNGYVSTPGGRFWFINGAQETATLICGEGCLAADPRYVQEFPVESTYTLRELQDREQGY